MSEENITTELVVLGAGPGGYPAAFMAADLGLEVTLIDVRDNPGGVCLYEGCIPSKALLHISKLLGETSHASVFGITYSEPSVDIVKLRTWKDGVVDKLTSGTGKLSRLRNIKYIKGYGKFKNSNTLLVHADNKETDINFKYAIIATGSSPSSIPGIEIDNDKILDSKGALDLHDIPARLLVIGGGYIGLEMGTVYASLGSEVTVVEMMDNLMPGVDKDFVKILAKKLNDIFKDILLGTKVDSIEQDNKVIKCTFINKEDDKTEHIFDKVLVSVGRSPNSSNIGLENTNVEITEKGFILVNENRQTTDPNIYAVGDVAGEPMLAHKATYEGKLTAEVISGKDVIYDPNAIPAVVFTDPEIAWCGISEDEAKNQGIDYTATRYNWSGSSRATTLGRNDGMTKLIVDNKTERILGVGIVGVGAGEMIAEGVLAMEMGATAADLKLTIHPHPTLTETMMESAELFYGPSTHMYKKK